MRQHPLPIRYIMLHVIAGVHFPFFSLAYSVLVIMWVVDVLCSTAALEALEASESRASVQGSAACSLETRSARKLTCHSRHLLRDRRLGGSSS